MNAFQEQVLLARGVNHQIEHFLGHGRARASLPSTAETSVREQLPESERIELCRDAKQVVAAAFRCSSGVN